MYGTARFKLDTRVYQTCMRSIDFFEYPSRVVHVLIVSTRERTRIIHLLLSLFVSKSSTSHHIRVTSRA